MKKTFILIVCFALLLGITPSIHAAGTSEVVYTNEYTLENGLTVQDEVTIYTAVRASDKTASYKRSFYDGDTLVAYIVLQATFAYDGSSVSVVSKSVTQSDTYDGWSYVQNSLTSSGGTVTLNAKLTKWIILNTSFTMTLSCDKDGNISYT